MRRILPLVAALIMMLGVIPARAQVPVVVGYGTVDQFADSAWVVKEGDEKVMYFAMAARGAGAFVWGGAPIPYADVNGWGVVGKGHCESRKNFTFCSASGRAYPLEPGDLQFDPLLISASMKIDRPNAKHNVRWTGEGDVFYPGYYVGGSIDYVGFGTGIARHASIEGRIWGEKLERRSPFWSDLFEGAEILAGAFLEDRGYSFSDYGSVTLKVRFPNR